MAGILPPAQPSTKAIVSYFVFYNDFDLIPEEEAANSRKVDWKVAGIVTLLETDYVYPGRGEAPNAQEGGAKLPHRAVELGYLFVPEAWGKGYATESSEKVLQVYCEQLIPQNSTLPLEIQANANALNTASMRVLQKLGFKEVGRFEKEGDLPLISGSQTYSVVHFIRN